MLTLYYTSVDITIGAVIIVFLNLTRLSISKDTGIVAHEGVVQQTLSKALEHDILTCIRKHA